MLKSFDVMQQKSRSCTLRQPCDGPFQVQPIDASPLAGLADAHDLFVQSRCYIARSRLPALEMIEAAVHRQAIEPGADGGIAAKFGELSIGLQEDLLQEILRIGPGPAHPPREVEQPRRMLLIELLESWDISSGHSARLDEMGGSRVDGAFRSANSTTPAPPQLCEVPDAAAGYDDPFLEQQGALGVEVAAVAAQLAAGGDDPMARDGRIAGFAHDVADRAMGTGPPGRSRDVAVGGHPAVRDAPDRRPDARGELRGAAHH
jgi:hypothetical protein